MRARMEAAAERHEASSRVFPRVPVSPPPPATASRSLILRSSPFRPQMETKKSSAQHQPRAMEPKKPSPRGAGAAAAATTEAESPLTSLFYPPAHGANGKDKDLYSILYKEQSGSAQADMTVQGGQEGSSHRFSWRLVARLILLLSGFGGLSLENKVLYGRS
ncbi:uncharacterized protein LOC133909152 isoform X3 [Phragmites australis]|uniref:uncharacterized protein LOC133909152 isoform X3 n=1 Tax=Phragmites australis TaxID=29695 RepID=UPI002D793E8E|nr:uncharacterized protein LOC133909152 isoform X3 [Phragmites australis]